MKFVSRVLLGSLLLASGLSAAVEVDHAVVSPAGYRTATVKVNATAAWVASKSECPQGENLAKTERTDTQILLTIEADRLTIGKNNLFLCVEPEPGKSPIVTPFEIERNDTVPSLTLQPPQGEFGTLPEIKPSSTNAAHVICALGEIEPAFGPDGTAKVGENCMQGIKPTGQKVQIRARAISAAGVLSPIVSGEYTENKRLRGWNGLDVYAGALYFSTLGSVKTYLPSGVGSLIGLRYGLDQILAPSQGDIHARPFWLPGAWTELQYLRFDNNTYRENIIALVAGPEWQLPLNGNRTLLVTFGAGVGAAQLAVKTPSYEASGLTTALSAKTGIEWQLGALALSAQVRYAYFADQASPLSGVGFFAGVSWKL